MNEVDNFWHGIRKRVTGWKVISRGKKGVFEIYLISHGNDNEFNDMSLFGVRRFSVDKEN